MLNKDLTKQREANSRKCKKWSEQNREKVKRKDWIHHQLKLKEERARMGEYNRKKGRQPRPKGNKSRPELFVSDEEKVKRYHAETLAKDYLYFSQEQEFTWEDLPFCLNKFNTAKSDDILSEPEVSRSKNGRKWVFWSNDDNAPCFQVSTKKGLDERDLRKLVGEFKDYRLTHSKRPLPNIDESEGWSHDDSKTLNESLENEDAREVVLSSIRLRRGQSNFRQKLIREHGAKCAVTGCDVLAVLEAAHIKPYRGKQDHKVENGLLLRADIHTLFDLDLLAVHPTTLEVAIHPDLDGGVYMQYAGKRIEHLKSQMLIKAALSERWNVFLRNFNPS